MDDSKRTAQDAQIYIAIVVALMALVAIYYFYQPQIWHFTKSTLFSWIIMIPSDVRAMMFFYTDYTNVIEAIHKNLQESRPAYFFVDSEGYIKKQAIDEASRWFTIPYIAPFIVYFAYQATKGGVSEFQKGISLQRFAEMQSDIFVYIKPVVYKMAEVVNQKSLDEGQRAIAKIPAQWVKDNDLTITAGQSYKTSLTKSQRKTLSLKKQRLFLKLKEDLGRPWGGFDDLTEHEVELLSVIVPHIYGKVAESRIQNRFLALAYSSDESKEGKELVQYAKDELKIRLESFKREYRYAFETPYFDDTEFDDPFDPMLQSFSDVDSEEQLVSVGDEMVKKTLLTHNYVSTVIISLLVKSWTYGVLSSAEMLWVRSADRTLWYLISQAGRKSSFIESAAAWSHYVSEDAYGFKMIAPQLYPGMKGVDYEMWKTHPNYEPMENSYNNEERWEKIVPKIEV